MNSVKSVLIVEDDLDILAMLAEDFSTDYTVDTAKTATAAKKYLRGNPYTAIILDVGLPDGSGVALCAWIRSQGIISPIIMLSGSIDETTKVAALKAGADDYVTKPHSIKELRARIEAQTRRSTLSFEGLHSIEYKDIVLDRANRTVRIEGQIIQLRRKEYEIMEILMLNKEHLVSRDQILEQAWDTNTDLFTNSVDVHMSTLRKKIQSALGTQPIQTVYGYGYRLNY